MTSLLIKPTLSTLPKIQQNIDILGINRIKNSKVFLDKTTPVTQKILISAFGFLQTYSVEIKKGEHGKLNIHDLDLLKTILYELKKEVKHLKITSTQIKTVNIELFENMAKITDKLDVMGAIVGVSLLDKYIGDSGRLKVLIPLLGEIINNHKKQTLGKNDKKKRRILDNTLLGAENIYNMFYGDDIVSKKEFYERRTKMKHLLGL